jgi:putative transposase
MDIFEHQPKSFVEPGNVYFFTATISHWYRLLEDGQLKQIIIDSLKNLSERKKIEVYGFVVMPNHVHIIWKINGSKSEELPHVSFLKFTAHCFKSTW